MKFLDFLFGRKPKFVTEPPKKNPFENVCGQIQVTYFRTETERERNFAFDFYGWDQMMEKLSEHAHCDKIVMWCDKPEEYEKFENNMLSIVRDNNARLLKGEPPV